MQVSPAQVFLFQNLRILTQLADTVDLCIYEPQKKLYITKKIHPEDLGFYEIIAAADHPNLAKIDFIIPYGNEYRVVREYISGDCLSDIIEGGRTYPPEKAARMIYDICSGLSVLHQHSIVHRDINPNNIIITTDGCVKIIDYGIARIFKKDQSRDTINVGTPGYAAPEQYGFSQSDSRTDIYSIGVLLNVLICGKPPLEQTVGGDIGKIIKKCTQMDAGKRYSNILELMRDIEKKTNIRVKKDDVELKTSALDKIIGNIPGIRTGKLYFVIPAAIWYIFAFIMVFQSFIRAKPGFLNYLNCLILNLCLFCFPTICFHNVFDIWNRFPLTKSSSRKSQRALFITLGIVFIFIGILFMGLLEYRPS